MGLKCFCEMLQIKTSLQVQLHTVGGAGRTGRNSTEGLCFDVLGALDDSKLTSVFLSVQQNTDDWKSWLNKNSQEVPSLPVTSELDVVIFPAELLHHVLRFPPHEKLHPADMKTNQIRGREAHSVFIQFPPNPRKRPTTTRARHRVTWDAVSHDNRTSGVQGSDPRWRRCVCLSLRQPFLSVCVCVNVSVL